MTGAAATTAAPGTAPARQPGASLPPAAGDAPRGARSHRAAGDGRRLPRPSRLTLEAVALWVGTRAALVMFTVAACWLLGIDKGGRLHGSSRWFLERFAWWDTFHFLRIVGRGYLDLAHGGGDQAFFPGYPLAIRAVAPLVHGNAALAGFVVSVVAGTVAAAVLAHLGRLVTGSPRGGRAAVVALAVAPYGFFLVAVYSEALFLACTLAAWAAALTRRWWLAGVLAALASTVRVNGLFLAAALAVLYLQQAWSDRRGQDGTYGSDGSAGTDGTDVGDDAVAPRRRLGARLRLRPDALALGLPLLATGAFVAYLHHVTGSWTAWQDAQDVGWHRGTAPPWRGIQAGVESALSANHPDLVLSRWADVVATLGGCALLLVLLALRRWAEAVFVLLNVGVLVCSNSLLSAPRFAITWFPAYLLLAQLAVSRRWSWTLPAVVVACVPLLGVVALSFAGHFWTA